MEQNLGYTEQIYSPVSLFFNIDACHVKIDAEDQNVIQIHWKNIVVQKDNGNDQMYKSNCVENGRVFESVLELSAVFQLMF